MKPEGYRYVRLHPDLGRALLVAGAICSALVAVARGWGMLR